MPSGFDVRGVIEGFYGPPWSATARHEVLGFLVPRGLNAYVYAPKDDPKHRHRWREPYEPDELDELVELAAWCAERGIRFAMSLSPGLDVDYSSPADRDALWEKLLPFVEAGVDWLVLAFDDVPHRPGAAMGQAEMTASVFDRLVGEHPAGRMTVVPTDYVGTDPTTYLDELCERLPEEVDVCWTGRTIVPPTITADEARGRGAATGGRPPMLWDNYPVNDSFMSDGLHLGPLAGRDPALHEHCSGLLANPMPQARASLVALATAMAYASDPAGYDASAAWTRAVADVAEAYDAPWLAVLADACSTSALTDPATTTLHRLVHAGEPAPLRAYLEDALAAVREVGHDPLADEVRPWLDQVQAECRAGLEAVSVLESGDATDEATVLHALTMAEAWRTARKGGPIVYGPRLACYASVVQHGNGLALDPRGVVVEGASAVDQLCRAALGALGAAL